MCFEILCNIFMMLRMMNLNLIINLFNFYLVSIKLGSTQYITPSILKKNYFKFFNSFKRHPLNLPSFHVESIW